MEGGVAVGWGVGAEVGAEVPVDWIGRALGAGPVASGRSPRLRQAWVAAVAAAVRPTVWTN